jgi:hypothetical protein
MAVYDFQVREKDGWLRLERRADPRVDASQLLLIAGFGLIIRGAGLNYVSASQLFQDGAIGSAESSCTGKDAIRRKPDFPAAIIIPS